MHSSFLRLGRVWLDALRQGVPVWKSRGGGRRSCLLGRTEIPFYYLCSCRMSLLHQTCRVKRPSCFCSTTDRYGAAILPSPTAPSRVIRERHPMRGWRPYQRQKFLSDAEPPLRGIILSRPTLASLYILARIRSRPAWRSACKIFDVKYFTILKRLPF